MLSKVHIAIEGAVAVGKSTLLPKLHSVFQEKGIVLDLVLEPVDKWVNWKGPNGQSWNLLELMYQNTEKYAFRFQMAAAISKIQSLNDSPKPAKLVERTLRCQEKVFIPLLIKNGFLNELDQSLLENFFEMVRTGSSKSVVADVIIYLRTTPEIALTRVRSRNRQGEETVSLDYLTDLHKYYDNWLLHEENVVVVDVGDFAKVDPEQIYSRVLSCLEK